jgi:hypothetical protein
LISKQTDAGHDRTVEDSFPASDPPASTGITGPRAKDPGRVSRNPKADPTSPEVRGEHARPKSTPTDDRHAAETAYQREHEDHPPKR